MALEYKVYLDNTLLADLPGGLDAYEATVIRESGVTSEDQVLRLKREIELMFIGDGYAYICAQKKANYCANINIRIYLICDGNSRLDFIGIIPITGTTTDPTRKTVKTRIRDNSFSGMLRERQANKIFLSGAKTANGTETTSCPFRSISMFDSAGAPVTTGRGVYDIYEVLKYLIKVNSNDTVTVVSDYFTTGAGYNKYGIAMGGMLYYGVLWSQAASYPNIYIPNVSLQEVFTEMRKKVRLYWSVDFDQNGNATMKIGQEHEFFSDTVLFAIDEIPNDLIEEYDQEQVYSGVEVGSSETKVDDGTFYTYPDLFLTSWEKESFNSCSDCVEQNILNLVSEWVIDSNVIHYTIGQAVPDSPLNLDFADKVFLIETDQYTDTATQYVFAGNGSYYYNDLLTNINVLRNWARGIPECVSKYLQDVCLDVCADDTAYGSGGGGDQVDVEFQNVTCGNQIFTELLDFTTDFNTFNDTATYMVIPADGDYDFLFTGTFESQNSGAFIAIQMFIMQSSANLTSGSNEQANIVSNPTLVYNLGLTETKTLTISTGVLSLSAGNAIVFVYTYFQGSGTTVVTNVCAELTYYSISESYNFVSDDFLRKPIKWTFSHEVCETDYQATLQDKTGCITIKGTPGWIKEFIYRRKRVSTITLQAAKTLCC